jgi:predicted ATPase
VSGPASVAHYVIERELGRGGMGVVYRALDTRLGRAVAVKSLPAEFVQDARWLARFRAEAQSLAAVNHPNIAAIYGIETDATGTYLVLELADGPALSERIQSAPPGVEEALAITRQVALGIAEAHARGIVHRDLKPGNVKVREDGLVKVLDFGIAKSGRFDEPVDAFAATVVQPMNGRRTVPGFMLGTPGYMSPEQARGQTVDQATDVWSLGCVLYECLAHRMAFPGETLADVIAQTILGEPEWAALPRKTPGRVLRLMQACLRKSAGARGVTMQQAAVALEEGLRELSVGRVFMTSSSSAGAEEHAPERGNVPAMERPLIGRAGLVGKVVELLGQRRLVAVTGGAGAGVRSVARAAALRAGEEVRGGVWWVHLPALSDPGLPAVLTAFALRVRGRGAGVMEELVERIGTRSLLLVLDGCSHAPAGVAGMAVALLRACPNLRVLSVARGPLVVEGEAVVQVGAVGEVGQPPGLEFARLLLERAPAWQARAGEAVRVAQSLKGMPGAVDLCAGLAASMTPSQFEAQLRQRAVMAGCGDLDGASAERVLAILAAWAVDVQPAAVLALLMRAALFVGPFSTRALRAVGGAVDVVPGPGTAWDGAATVQDQRQEEQLARLAAAGLVRRVGETSTVATRPAWALPEVVRREALQRLGSTPGAQEMVRRGYVAYAQALAQEAGSRLGGPLAEPAAQRLEWEFADLAHAAGLAIDAGPVRRAMDELLTLRGLMGAG